MNIPNKSELDPLFKDKPASTRRFIRWQGRIGVAALILGSIVSCGDDIGDPDHSIQDADSESEDSESEESELIEAAEAIYTEDCDDVTRICSTSHAVRVRGSLMHYREAGNPNGKPIVLLHGQPVWSYLYRDIIPALPPEARIIAPDSIGYGFSQSPDIEYSWLEHVDYMEAFIDTLGLTDITFVVMDIGSFQGLAYAQRHPDKVKGLVMFEAILGPGPALDQFPIPPGPGGESVRNFIDALIAIRGSAAEAERLVVDENYFIETFLPDAVVRSLDEATMDAYRYPFRERSSRYRLLGIPLGIPAGGFPAENHEFVLAYQQYLGSSEVPKLLIHGEPGFIIPPTAATNIGSMLPNTEVVNVGPGSHFLPEDQPGPIAASITAFYRDRVWPSARN